MAILEMRGEGKKNTARAQPNQFVTYLLWIFATTIGWFAGVFNLDFHAKTYMDVVRLMPIYLADGLLIGLIVGVGQALVLRRFTNLNWTWVWATAVGYGLTFLMGLIVSISIPSVIWRLQGEYLLPFAQPATVSIFLNWHDIFWGGFLIGSMQWRVLKKTISNPNRNKALLWMLANWFVLGASLFISAFTHKTFLANFHMGMMGIAMGVITGAILLSFLSNYDPLEE